MYLADLVESAWPAGRLVQALVTIQAHAIMLIVVIYKAQIFSWAWGRKGVARGE